MKILVLNPPTIDKTEYIREGRCMQSNTSWGNLWMPLTLSYIASVLCDDGHIVKLVDCLADDIKIKDLNNIVKEFNPFLIILNSSFPSIKGDIQTAVSIKIINKKIRVVMIGMYPTLLKEETLKKHKCVDYSIIGEPEWTIRKLVKALNSNISLDNINGLIYRKDSRIMINKRQDFSANSLDDLPMPARDLLNNDAYTHVADSQRFTLLNVSRGCPYNCSFCSAHFYYGKKFRKRNIESIICEIKECINNYKIKKFLFWGESFTFDRIYGMQIASAIIENNLEITWYSRSRVDNLDLELLKEMKKAGCEGISIGIESMEQNVLNRCNKRIKVSQTIEAINMIKKAGLHVTGHFIFGLPGDTYTAAKKSIDFACKSNLDFAQFYCAVPYPSTNLWYEAINKKWIKSFDYSRYHLADSIMKNDSLYPKDIRILREEAFRKFYLRPKFYINSIFVAAKNNSISPILNFIRWAKA